MSHGTSPDGRPKWETQFGHPGLFHQCFSGETQQSGTAHKGREYKGVLPSAYQPWLNKQSLSKQARQPHPEITQLLYPKANASSMVLPRILIQHYQLNNTAVFLISPLLHSSIQGSWGRWPSSSFGCSGEQEQQNTFISAPEHLCPQKYEIRAFWCLVALYKHASTA